MTEHWRMRTIAVNPRWKPLSLAGPSTGARSRKALSRPAAKAWRELERLRLTNKTGEWLETGCLLLLTGVALGTIGWCLSQAL
jgi:hypothetical protein